MGNIHVEKVEGGRLAPSTDLHLRICEWRNDHRLHAEPCGGMTIACKKDACVDIKNYPFQAKVEGGRLAPSTGGRTIACKKGCVLTSRITPFKRAFERQPLGLADRTRKRDATGLDSRMLHSAAGGVTRSID